MKCENYDGAEDRFDELRCRQQRDKDRGAAHRAAHASFADSGNEGHHIPSSSKGSGLERLKKLVKNRVTRPKMMTTLALG